MIVCSFTVRLSSGLVAILMSLFNCPSLFSCPCTVVRGTNSACLFITHLFRRLLFWSCRRRPASSAFTCKPLFSLLTLNFSCRKGFLLWPFI